MASCGGTVVAMAVLPFRVVSSVISGGLLVALAGCEGHPQPREDVAQNIDAMAPPDAGREDAPQDVGRDYDVVLFDAVADGAMAAGDVISEPLCRPGETRCAATGTREVCAADAQQFLPAPCPMEQLCVSGSCVARLCVPLSSRCAGPTSIETCSVDGTSYGPVSACAPGFGCNSMTNSCAPFVCMPGSATGCTSVTARAVCGADGQGASAVECASGESCAVGVCRARVCTPSATRCAGSGSVETCALDGLMWSAEACGARRSCVGGACTPWLCTPGESRCAGSGASEACSGDGLSYQSPTPCGVGESCASATGRCERWLCAPGTATCVGNVRRGCNADDLGPRMWRAGLGRAVSVRGCARRGPASPARSPARA
jgi:hypothetical protein